MLKLTTKSLNITFHIIIFGENIMVERVTIAFDDFIYERVQGVRNAIMPILIEKKILRDLSFTTTVNLLLVASLVGAPDFKQDKWHMLVDFLTQKGNELNAAEAKRAAEEIKKRTIELGIPSLFKIKHEKTTKR